MFSAGYVRVRRGRVLRILLVTNYATTGFHCPCYNVAVYAFICVFLASLAISFISYFILYGAIFVAYRFHYVSLLIRLLDVNTVSVSLPPTPFLRFSLFVIIPFPFSSQADEVYLGHIYIYIYLYISIYIIYHSLLWICWFRYIYVLPSFVISHGLGRWRRSETSSIRAFLGRIELFLLALY